MRKKRRNLLFFISPVYFLGSFHPILIKYGGGGEIKTNLSKNIVGKVKTVTVK